MINAFCFTTARWCPKNTDLWFSQPFKVVPCQENRTWVITIKTPNLKTLAPLSCQILAKRDCHGLTPVNNQTHDSCSLTPHPPSGWKNWKGSEKTQGLRLNSLIQYRNNTNTLLVIYIKWKKKKWYSMPHELHPHWAASPGNRVPWSQTAYPG